MSVIELGFSKLYHQDDYRQAAIDAIEALRERQGLVHARVSIMARCGEEVGLVPVTSAIGIIEKHLPEACDIDYFIHRFENEELKDRFELIIAGF